VISEECCEVTRVSKVKLEERGAKVVFLNSDNTEFVKIRVDGCVVANESAADWALVKRPIGDLLVELKGRNIELAVKQLTATMRLWRDNKLSCGGKIGALVVSRQVPKATIMQKVKLKFMSEFRCPIHVVSHNQEFIFERVLDSRGPN
jgi:hypothetical protein